MTIGIGLLLRALLHLLDNVRIPLSQRLQVLIPPRARFHRQQDIGVGSVHQPQQLIYSAITDVDICGQQTQVVAGRTTAVFRSIYRCSCRERQQLCDIERETGKRGQDKHTNGEF
jgi:hypothetical protein